jgi:hypothetical protein
MIPRALKWVIASTIVLLPVAVAAAPRVVVAPLEIEGGGEPEAVGRAFSAIITADLSAAGVDVAPPSEVRRLLTENQVPYPVELKYAVALAKALDCDLLLLAHWQENGPAKVLAYDLLQRGVEKKPKIVESAGISSKEEDIRWHIDTLVHAVIKYLGRDVKPLLKVKHSAPRSMKTLELYGQAVGEPDSKKRRELLKAVLKLDPEFEYAKRDLKDTL